MASVTSLSALTKSAALSSNAPGSDTNTSDTFHSQPKARIPKPAPIDGVDPVLNEKQLAFWLGVSIPTVQRWRAGRTGPAFVRPPASGWAIAAPRSRLGWRHASSTTASPHIETTNEKPTAVAAVGSRVKNP